MKSYDEDRIPEFLHNYRNVAVVGISDNPDRDSHVVATYLRDNGFNILPVNPKLQTWKGIKVYPDLKSIPVEVGVDVVDVFRKPDAVMDIVKEALHLRPKLIWLQEGVVNEEAADFAKSSGVSVVMDRCMMKEHSKLR